MSKELTDKWKNRQLECGYYYLKLKNGDIEIQDNFIGGFLMSELNPIVDVLAPVPTYEEYKNMNREPLNIINTEWKNDLR